jgi:hypothetical protein
MGERADIGLLDHDLGLGVVTQDAARKPVKPAIVRRHDGAHGSLVAIKCPADQFSVVGASSFGPGRMCWRMAASLSARE